MNETIFLSAGVPDPRREPEYASTADIVAIQAAVSALVHVVLGRRLLVWGGHPAITPMIWVAAADMGVDYGGWVRLYQSRYFKDEFPEDNARFHNVTFCGDVNNDRQQSLRAMREKMLTDHSFSAAVFIGGMGGIIDEYDLLQKLQPNAKILPIASCGGAGRKLAENNKNVPLDLWNDLDYVGLIHRHLGIAVAEQRYLRPQDQPVDPKLRLRGQVTSRGSDP